jgi:hypothetical protein
MGYFRDANEGKGAMCYLSGPITNDTSTTNWRPGVISLLEDRYGIDVFDPFSDPKQHKVGDIAAAKKAKDKQEVQRIVSGFVRKDLGKIDRSDFVLARFAYENIYLPQDVEKFTIGSDFSRSGMLNQKKIYPIEPRLRQVPTTGTIHEIINADLYHKPTLLVSEHGWWTLPEWLLGFVPTRYWFSSFAEVYEYLDRVDKGDCKDDDRWAFLYGLV